MHKISMLRYINSSQMASYPPTGMDNTPHLSWTMKIFLKTFNFISKKLQRMGIFGHRMLSTTFQPHMCKRNLVQRCKLFQFVQPIFGLNCDDSTMGVDTSPFSHY